MGRRHARTLCWIPFLAALVLPTPALAKPIVAVFDIENRDAPLAPRAVDGLTGYLVARIAASGAYDVVPREQVKARLVEQKKDSYRSCYAESCQIELGRELAAQKSLATVILKIGKTCEITATLYDLARATTERAATAGGPCTEEGVKEALEAVARELSAKVEEAPAPADPLASVKDDVARGFAKTAQALLDEGKADEALPLVRKAYAREAAPEILLLLARTFEAQGALGEARKAYEGYLQAGKDPATLAAARKRLEAVLDRLPGRLRVAVDPPDATLEVDGAAAVRPAPGGLELRRGTHRIRVARDGYAPEERTVEVAAGAETALELDLAPLPGRLAVECDRPGARLVVDGVPRGTLPLPAPLELPAGRHEVEVTAPGCERHVSSVTLAPGGMATLPLSLVALPAAAPEPARREATALPAAAPVEGVSDRAPASVIAPWQWVMIGTGVAALVAGGVCSGLAARDRAAITGSTRSGNVVTGMSLPEARSLASRADTRDKAGYALYAVGGAAAFAGIVMAIVDATRHRPAPTAQALAAPVAGGMVLGATGRF